MFVLYFLISKSKFFLLMRKKQQGDNIEFFQLFTYNIYGALHDLVPFVQFKKNVKNTHREVLLLITLQVLAFSIGNNPPWVFFMFFKSYKWYQITQRISFVDFFRKLLLAATIILTTCTSTVFRCLQTSQVPITISVYSQISNTRFTYLFHTNIAATTDVLH